MQLQAASGAQSVGVTRARSTAFRFLRKERGNSVSWEVSSSSGRVEQGCKRKDECGDVQEWGDRRAAFISYLCLQFIFLPDPVQKTFLLLWFLFLFIFFHRFHLQPNFISFLRLRQRSFRSWDLSSICINIIFLLWCFSHIFLPVVGDLQFLGISLKWPLGEIIFLFLK